MSKGLEADRRAVALLAAQSRGELREDATAVLGGPGITGEEAWYIAIALMHLAVDLGRAWERADERFDLDAYLRERALELAARDEDEES